MGWNWSKRWDEVKDLDLGIQNPHTPDFSPLYDVSEYYAYLHPTPGPMGFLAWLHITKNSFSSQLNKTFYERRISTSITEDYSDSCYYMISELDARDWTDEKLLASYPHLAYSC